MTDTKKSLFKLTPQSEGAFYELWKYAHDEKNVYGEVKSVNRDAAVTVNGEDEAIKKIYKDTMPDKFTIEVDEDNPLEILRGNVVKVDEGQIAGNLSDVKYIDEFWENVEVFVNQRRYTVARDKYPQVDDETLWECEGFLQENGLDEDYLEDNGWKLLGVRVGFSHGEVEIEKVSEVSE